jgi:hypothetical protein
MQAQIGHLKQNLDAEMAERTRSGQAQAEMFVKKGEKKRNEKPQN